VPCGRTPVLTFDAGRVGLVYKSVKQLYSI
jgi:hypothetical protein